jgi:hypothetical protein
MAAKPSSGSTKTFAKKKKTTKRTKTSPRGPKIKKHER